MVELDAASVKTALSRLQNSNATIFGAESHGFLLNPPVLASNVTAFEAQHNIQLPSDYRYFLTQIGNGGAGPSYGVFPLGKMDWNIGRLQLWRENNEFVGVLSLPFPFEVKWNEVAGMPSDELLVKDEGEYERQSEAFHRKCWRAIDGAIPICHEGCAIRIWLVVTGPQAGYLWRDGRSEYTGFNPLKLADGRTATFSSWYNEWLQLAIQAIP